MKLAEKHIHNFTTSGGSCTECGKSNFTYLHAPNEHQWVFIEKYNYPLGDDIVSKIAREWYKDQGLTGYDFPRYQWVCHCGASKIVREREE